MACVNVIELFSFTHFLLEVIRKVVECDFLKPD